MGNAISYAWKKVKKYKWAFLIGLSAAAVAGYYLVAFKWVDCSDFLTALEGNQVSKASPALVSNGRL